MGRRDLIVKVLNGRDLKNKKAKGDPYCRVEIGDLVEQTEHRDSDSDPVWNEYFTFDVPKEADIIALSVWDKSNVKKDHFMGMAYVGIENLISGQSNLRTAKLMGGGSGEVNLDIRPQFETQKSIVRRISVENEASQCENKDHINKIHSLKSEVSRLNNDNGRNATEICKLETEKNNLAGRVERLEDYVKKMAEENGKLSEHNKKLEEEIEKLGKEVDRLTNENNTLLGCDIDWMEEEEPEENKEEEKKKPGVNILHLLLQTIHPFFRASIDLFSLV